MMQQEKEAKTCEEQSTELEAELKQEQANWGLIKYRWNAWGGGGKPIRRAGNQTNTGSDTQGNYSRN